MSAAWSLSFSARIRLVNSHNRLCDIGRISDSRRVREEAVGLLRAQPAHLRKISTACTRYNQGEDLLTSLASVPLSGFLDRTAAVLVSDASEVVRSTRPSTTVSENDGSMEVTIGIPARVTVNGLVSLGNSARQREELTAHVSGHGVVNGAGETAETNIADTRGPSCYRSTGVI